MEEQNQLVIQYGKLELLVNGSDKIAMSPDGEELLVKLLELSELVESAINETKRRLASKMESISPDLSSISSDKVKIMYRNYGAKYFIPDTLIDQIDPKFYNQKTSYSPNTFEIDKSIKETGMLPSGIGICARTKSVSINLKDKKMLETEE